MPFASRKVFINKEINQNVLNIRETLCRLGDIRVISQRIMSHPITQQLLVTAYSYQTYRSLLENLMAQGKTTGNNQSEDYLNYARINLQRMGRLDKTVTLLPQLQQQLQVLSKKCIWLVITEGWCGDAAQNLPVMALIENECPHIELKLVLRDEHPTLMDNYLTNGSRSIPILICLEKETLKQLFVWGPRPAELQAIVMELVKNKTPKTEKGLITQKWYNEDKTLSLQGELLKLIQAI